MMVILILGATNSLLCFYREDAGVSHKTERVADARPVSTMRPESLCPIVDVGYDGLSPHPDYFEIEKPHRTAEMSFGLLFTTRSNNKGV